MKIEKVTLSTTTYYYRADLVSEAQLRDSHAYDYSMLHNEEGPAIVRPYGNIYILFGKEFSKEDYCEAVKYLEENDYISFKLKYVV